ncbi:MAG: TonB C-terminal domain-containing protein [FCB group bacterium]|jgi:protein TonB|nr:TonB C-terminal domain-containing protein [FCB group bacterium]
MRIQRDFYTLARRPSRGLRRGTVVSVIIHLVFIGALTTAAYFFQGPPPLNIIEVGVMFAGLPDAPEGVESTKIEGLPPGIPEPKPAAAKPAAEKKPDPPKEKPKEEAKPPEPEKKTDPEKKVEPKKPDPEKKEEKKTKLAKEDKEKPKPEKKEEKPKDAFEKGDSLPDSGVDDLLEEEMANMALASASPGAGGLEGARPSDTAQIGLGDPLAEEYGISVRGMPSILGAWANDVRRAVKRQWREPGGLPLGSKTSISFWVCRDGQLLGEPEVYEPSNDAGLDQSAVNAVKLAAPFRPLPPGYNEPKQQVIFVFTIDN